MLIGGKVEREFGVKVAEMMFLIFFIWMSFSDCHQATNLFRWPIPRNLDSLPLPCVKPSNLCREMDRKGRAVCRAAVATSSTESRFKGPGHPASHTPTWNLISLYVTPDR